ncbi:GbsR/MarR family transcriptional regulator [Nocardia arthritidis]|uniref:Helix-turn-helix domain-containing protein n=1 Tax=Nocardia arthritidis TaxID=228602 RepID=A0A6G9YBM1_9NOCA|nr:helix-turn-helix domain-containing protein [Nocardia arthritidis]QIS10477.1 helix-turn-helix domain-containing protein [Nocardia arthritidis]
MNAYWRQRAREVRAMPGGRLTSADRDCIAAGLAEGLGYAEIARQLDRPTSTISREVARNGGPGRYHAEWAHLAAKRRARRTDRRRAAVENIDIPIGFDRDLTAVHEFAVRVVTLLTDGGMPRTPARVLACFFVSDSGRLTSADLSRRLRVSPASISKALRHLMIRDLIQRERHSGRADHYVLDADAWFRATLVSVRILGVLSATARDGSEILGATTPAGTRLDEMASFLDRFGHDLVRTAERVRAALAAGADEPALTRRRDLPPTGST